VGSRFVAGGIAGLVLAFASACGGGGTAPTPGGSSGTPRPPATPVTGVGSECVKEAVEGATVIELTTHAFPAETKIAVGDTITWTNHDNLTHTVTFRGGPDCDVLFINGSVSVTFPNPGTFDYLCKFHDEVMRGKVIVE
jgi:plastocyanin